MEAASAAWRRPADASFPRLYRRVERAGAGAAGAPERYVIQDLPPEQDEEAVELMVHHFMSDEPTCKSTDAASDPHNVEEMRDYWRQCVAHRVSLACYRLQDEGAPRLVGLNMCTVCVKGDPKPDIGALRGAAWRQIMHTLLLTMATCDVYDALKVDRYLGGNGLLVLPELRGRGLARELVAAREPLCRAVGLRASATVFTATASQRVAERCGFAPLGELPYRSDEMRQLGYLYSDIDTPSAKLMGRRYEYD